MHATPHDCTTLQQLAALLAEDQVDAALDASLMDAAPDIDCTACAAASAQVLAAQQRLQTAWAARERYRARGLRLARRAAERQARRAPPPAPSSTPTPPSLPPAVAAALARAKARAAGTPNT
ncbi:hypothetical protein SAMN05428989_2600 [Pseudoxanthomonas sp. GM95]|uniref:hypothetical protein n=1 Tax=Pseudoxanthomonas sp. GM95 TaxID=1881043 RepID=UPI0008C18D87|nr:hypothetical protein [Pseudoxanthomonas sp. GM95]SEL82225.1 hypothetical protein SAMN05428989_2600 [Pseudoxanthomonas sp. GM95]